MNVTSVKQAFGLAASAVGAIGMIILAPTMASAATAQPAHAQTVSNIAKASDGWWNPGVDGWWNPGADAPAASDPATPAQRMPLTQTNRDCSGAVIGPPQDQPFGFAVIVRPASGRLIANVVLQGALPDTTYNIRLIQVLPNSADCFTIDGTLTTDSFGDGNANVQEPVIPGASSAWVDLNNAADSTNFYDTTPVSL
jgi:hypothetical protein